MAVKVRVSYTTEQELQKVLILLKPAIKSYKISKDNAGRYNKAYIELNT